MERLRHLPIREALLSVAVLACGTPQDRESLQGDQFIIDGSSTVSLISQALAENFNKEEIRLGRRVMVGVGVSGTGGGFSKFCDPKYNRGVSLIGASRPISPKEQQACKERGVYYSEIPIGIDGIAVIVDPQNSWVDYLTFTELKKMWESAAQGRITKWSQIRDGWPNQSFHLFGPGTASGTFDFFTEMVVGRSGDSRGDYNASESDDVLVQGVRGTINALGYFGYPYYVNNRDRLKVVPIDAGEGPVMPDEATIKSGQYPLSRSLFFYVNIAELRNNPAVRRLLIYFFENSETIVSEAGYIPLQPESYRESFEAIQKQGRILGEIPSP